MWKREVLVKRRETCGLDTERIREIRREDDWGCRRGVVGEWVDGWNEHTPPGGGVIKHPSIHPATHHLSAAPPGSSNPPHSCLPPPERGVDDGDDDDGLTPATSSNSKTISKTL